MQKTTDITLTDIAEELDLATDFLDVYSTDMKPEAKKQTMKAIADYVATAQSMLEDYTAVQKVKAAQQTATPHPSVVISISI